MRLNRHTTLDHPTTPCCVVFVSADGLRASSNFVLSSPFVSFYNRTAVKIFDPASLPNEVPFISQLRNALARGATGTRDLAHSRGGGKVCEGVAIVENSREHCCVGDRCEQLR